MLTLKVENWGLIDYEQALAKQLKYVDLVAENPALGFLIFCSHPPVVTLGSKTEPSDVFAWQGPVIEITRGGRATYHGPSQLVVYPILKVKDIHHYLRSLESAIVKTLSHYAISATGRTDETGVWVGGKKIASLGIGIKKWITYHGAAINLENDPKAFQGMRPCGFDREVMTNLESILGNKIENEEFQNILATYLKESLQSNSSQISSDFPADSVKTLEQQL